ncbi:hypothetical protein KJ616_03195 [Patescibacteria group bacterium]|nr:hypothetical protein [Patescibacteria group bacterium]
MNWKNIIFILLIIIVIILSVLLFIKSSDKDIAINCPKCEDCIECIKPDPKISELPDSFLKSDYRVIKIIDNQDGKYSLIVATKRSEIACGSPDDPSRCTDDNNCGSIYTARTCYFFLEPLYTYGANPETRFIATWEGGLDGLDKDSIEFKDDTTVIFNSYGGDSIFSVSKVLELNLETGEITLIKREDFTSEL